MRERTQHNRQVKKVDTTDKVKKGLVVGVDPWFGHPPWELICRLRMDSICKAGSDKRLSWHVWCIGLSVDFYFGLKSCGVRILGQNGMLKDFNLVAEDFPEVV